MDYTNLRVLKELRHIRKCHDMFGKSGRDCMDNTADCIYKENNSGILNYLTEKKYIIMQTSSFSGRTVPFLTGYGKDFLKYNSNISCYLKDNQWLINTLIGIFITIITGLIIYIITR